MVYKPFVNEVQNDFRKNLSPELKKFICTRFLL